MLGACLKKLGYSFSATDPRELQRAEQEAIAQKKLLRAYLNAEVRDQLVSGDVVAAQLWSTTAQQAIDAAPSLGFAFPAEGFPFYCDCAVILRESGRTRLAHQFLDYLLRPKVSGADCASPPRRPLPTAPHGTCCRRTYGRIRCYIRRPDIYQRGEWPRSLPSAAQRLRDRIWTEIKSA